MATNFLRKEALTHSQKVCRIYKKAQNIICGDNRHSPARWRYFATLMRAEFDKYKDLPPEQAKQKLEEAEKWVRSRATAVPFRFANSVGGSQFGRNPVHPDMLVDGWHPLEKAQYPTYFATREIRKREYIERYEQEYGTSSNKPADA